MTDTPIFTKVAYTGQPETDYEEIACPECGTLKNLRSSAWFDPYNKKFKESGCYVCYGCLSEQRQSEIKEAK